MTFYFMPEQADATRTRTSERQLSIFLCFLTTADTHVQYRPLCTYTTRVNFEMAGHLIHIELSYGDRFENLILRIQSLSYDMMVLCQSALSRYNG